MERESSGVTIFFEGMTVPKWAAAVLVRTRRVIAAEKIKIFIVDMVLFSPVA